MARRIIDGIEEALSENRRFFALEFFPPKTPEGEANLYPRMDKLNRQLAPLWCGLTHGDSAAHALNIAHTTQSVLSIDTQVNVPASSFRTQEELAAWLRAAQAAGLRNLLLLRGVAAPPPDGAFQTAADLVRFVRAQCGAYFCLAVAGHPEGYDGDPATYPRAIRDLADKVAAGADLVISAMCFAPAVFLKFCADCRAAGIRCPIIPGIMPVQSRAQFRHWFDRPGCAELKARVEALNRHDDAEVKRIGVEFTTGLLKQLFRGGVRGAYFFTMNMETVVTSIVEAAGLAAPVPKELPWRRSADPSRSQRERQRPIFWSGRPTSYLARTGASGAAPGAGGAAGGRGQPATDDFPNGRYGDAMSPAFGENTTYHTAIALSAAARNCHWMFAAKTLADVADGFVAFLEGRGRLPWCEEMLAPEADLLLEGTLKPLNRRGLFTINSQPAANGLPSDDPRCGWGPPGGYVYQKQYLEFFCSRDVLARILPVFAAAPSIGLLALDARGIVVEAVGGYAPSMSQRRPSVASSLASPTVPAPPGDGSLHAHHEDDDDLGGDGEQRVTTVTWGVFPGRPVLQPTTVSLAAFRAWAPEAFSLWSLPFASGVGAASPAAAGAGTNSGGGGGGHSSSSNAGADARAASGGGGGAMPRASSSFDVVASSLGGGSGGTAAPAATSSGRVSPPPPAAAAVSAEGELVSPSVGVGGGAGAGTRSTPLAVVSAAPPMVRFAPVLTAGEFPPAMPAVLRTMALEWVLVSVVDNEFVAVPTPLDDAVRRICALLPEIASTTAK